MCRLDCSYDETQASHFPRVWTPCYSCYIARSIVIIMGIFSHTRCKAIIQKTSRIYKGSDKYRVLNSFRFLCHIVSLSFSFFLFFRVSLQSYERDFCSWPLKIGLRLVLCFVIVEMFGPCNFERFGFCFLFFSTSLLFYLLLFLFLIS